MGSLEFLNICKEKVSEYFNNSKDKTDVTGNLVTDDVFVVWYCKTLQNHKALLRTPVSDGMYYGAQGVIVKVASVSSSNVIDKALFASAKQEPGAVPLLSLIHIYASVLSY